MENRLGQIDSLREEAIEFWLADRVDDAKLLFEKLVDEEDSIANCYLGQIYQSGLGSTPVNGEYARFYFEATTEEGWDTAAVCLGRMYYHGIVIERDYHNAKACFERLHSQGVTNTIADFFLGVMYFDGEGVESSNEKAIFHFSRGWSNGSFYCGLWLALAYKRARRYRKWLQQRFLLLRSLWIYYVRGDQSKISILHPNNDLGKTTVSIRATCNSPGK